MWRSAGDPSVYGFHELDVTDLPPRGSPLPLILQALAWTMRRHPELTSILSLGRVRNLGRVNISVMVAISEEGHKDLSAAFLEDADRMSLQQISDHIEHRSGLIRRRSDPHLGRALRMLRSLPRPFSGWLLRIYSLLVHDLGLDLRFLQLPKNPFGTAIVTNIGSLGLKRALVPLVPLTRAPLLIAVGEAGPEPKVIDGEIRIRQIIHLGVTFDHRFFDGAHAAAMLKDFDEAFRRFSLAERPSSDDPAATPLPGAASTSSRE